MGRREVVRALDLIAPNRHRGWRDPTVQASGVNVPWLFLFEIGAVGMLVAWLRRMLRRLSGAR